MFRPIRRLLLLALAAALIGCGSDSNEGSPECPAGEQRNPVSGQCEPARPAGSDAGDTGIGADTGPGDADGADTGGATDDTGLGDTASADTGSGETGMGDTGSADTGSADTASADTGTDPCDHDGDGYQAQSCGGQDCDDANRGVFPGSIEICDALDNDCAGGVNDGITCSFYAQTSSALYRIDPFARTATHLASVPGLFDIDTHPDGTLYGVASGVPGKLYRYDAAGDQWSVVGDVSTTGTANGMAIDNAGRAFITAGNTLYELDLATGQSTAVGSMGGGFNSSGDCVVNKGNTLFMSSNHSSGGDTLVRIDGTTGQASAVGPIGFGSVYGLTAAWGRMFGLTGAGKLIEIDPSTGQGTELHSFTQGAWYGAASTPDR